MSDAGAFRAQFPVFESLSYMNAGTEGPVPSATAAAVHARVESELAGGRCGPSYSEPLKALAEDVRAGYAAVLGCAASEVALTGSTTDGVNTVVAGLHLRRGDEILTSDEEHPGLLAPLSLARRRTEVSIRVVPFAELAGAVRPSTRLVACSHVSWVSGSVVDAHALSAAGAPVLLDGAQGLGAVPVDVGALRCDFYAASGQKWMCGPEGSGCLYVKPQRLDDLLVPWPGYSSVAEPERALDSGPLEGTGRFDHGFPSGMRSTWTLASMAVLRQTGWEWLHDRAATLAAWLADALAARGLEVGARGRSTLVSWKASDPAAEVERLAAARFVVRSIPAFSLVRASVGAWSSEEELQRLVDLAVT